MGLTTDPNDPRLGRGIDPEPSGQNKAYLILSEEERAKGFVRPVRTSYIHRYMEDGSPVPPEPWVKVPEGLKGCGVLTTMALSIAETYARDPKFYGATFCAGCNQHLPVSEFVWDKDNSQVGS